MTEERWRRLEELFTQARDLPSAERDSFVDLQTADDPNWALN